MPECRKHRTLPYPFSCDFCVGHTARGASCAGRARGTRPASRLTSKLCVHHGSQIYSSEIHSTEISDSVLRSSSMEKQFISSGAGAPDQLASALPTTALFSSPQRSAPHRCAFAKQRVDASRAARCRVPLRVVPARGRQATQGCQATQLPALQTGAERRTVLRRIQRLPLATDRLDRTHKLPAAASSASSVEPSLDADTRISRSPPGIHVAPAARRRQHRQLLQGDTTRNHRDGSWRRPLHRPIRPQDIAQLLRRTSSRLTGRPPASRCYTRTDLTISQRERSEQMSPSALGDTRSARPWRVPPLAGPVGDTASDRTPHSRSRRGARVLAIRPPFSDPGFAAGPVLAVLLAPTSPPPIGARGGLGEQRACACGSILDCRVARASLAADQQRARAEHQPCPTLKATLDDAVSGASRAAEPSWIV